MSTDLKRKALKALKQNSRTFYIPIARLPEKLQDAVASAYLCMRAIDEIEDNPELDNQTKALFLRNISLRLQESDDFDVANKNRISMDLASFDNILPQVALDIDDWVNLAPITIAPRIWDATAAMADRMAYWAEADWEITTEADLHRYTFSVAGSVGLLLSDLWGWYDGTETNRQYAIAFGRGLQAVNIIRNHSEDSLRGVNFIPKGWTSRDVQKYAHHQLKQAGLYIEALPENSPALDFCQIPYVLAKATLEAISQGKEKLSRNEVLSLVGNFSSITES